MMSCHYCCAADERLPMLKKLHTSKIKQNYLDEGTRDINIYNTSRLQLLHASSYRQPTLRFTSNCLISCQSLPNVSYTAMGPTFVYRFEILYLPQTVFLLDRANPRYPPPPIHLTNSWISTPNSLKLLSIPPV